MKGSKIGVSFNGGWTDTMFICQIPNMARDNNKYIKRIIWPWVIQLSCVPDIYQMELKPVVQVTLTGWCWEYSDVLFKTLHWEAKILPCFSGFRGLSQEHLWKHSVQTSPQNFWFSLRRTLRICLSTQFLGGTDAASPHTTIWNFNSSGFTL